MHCWLMAHSGSTLPAVGHGARGLRKHATARKSNPSITMATLRSHHPECGRLNQEQDGMTHARDAAKAKQRLEDDSYLGCEAVEGDGR